MTDDGKQTDATAGAKPSGASDPAKSDVDRLLSEFDQGTTAAKTETSSIKPLLEAFKPIASYAQRKMTEETTAAIKKSVADAVSAVKSSEGLKDTPDRVVRGYLQDRYAEDAVFRTAYEEQGKNPAAWQDQLGKAAVALAEDIKMISSNNVRSDVEAAQAAVKGAGKPQETKEEDNPESLFAMSDSQFRAFKDKKAAGARL